MPLRPCAGRPPGRASGRGDRGQAVNTIILIRNIIVITVTITMTLTITITITFILSLFATCARATAPPRPIHG